jgi:drug/metabolite transporter (DMT)-like permease
MKALLPFIFAIGTALCWGLYGVTLGKARSEDPSATPFKAWLGIGFAYLVMAIIGATLIMWFLGKDKATISEAVFPWGFGAGLLGALGALFLTLAMFNGGHEFPQAVMPVVFGGAVTVTAIQAVMFPKPDQPDASIFMWLGILGMGICTVIVAINTPHAHKPKKTPDSEHAAVAPEQPVEDQQTSS